MHAIIETHQLKKAFQVYQSKDRQPQIIEAVKGIDLVVRAGETFGFMGPNGAGKTTTLRMLATLIPPSSGQAHVAGYDLALGMVHQPCLLFLDEPTTGLDPQSRAWLWDEVRRLRANRKWALATSGGLSNSNVAVM